MASLDLRLYDIELNKIEGFSISSLELSRDMDAACDGLRLNLQTDEAMPELYSLTLFCDDTKIFNGYIDTQREIINDDGFSCFVYARSSACLLTDNASEPMTYTNASVNALFLNNAQELGFKNNIKSISSSGQYQVDSGTSCYGAINSFVYALTGDNVMVTPDDELELITPKTRAYISSEDILSHKRVINRSNAISEICYKLNSGTSYKYHIVSNLAKRNRIMRRLTKNVASVSDLQKDSVLENMMNRAGSSYYCLELLLKDFYDISLCSSVYVDSRLSDSKPWRVRSVTYLYNGFGFSTSLSLFKENDLEVVTYVDE